MATYRRGNSESSTYPTSHPTLNQAYRHISASRGSGVDIMLDVGEFCTGCAQTSRRLTVDGRLQTCSRHSGDSVSSRRSLDQLAVQLKKFNTRLLPDSTPSSSGANDQSPPTIRDTREQAKVRRGQQELYRQRSLSQKQAQYQQRLRLQRESLQNDSQRRANQSFSESNSYITSSPPFTTNPASNSASFHNNQTNNPASSQNDGDYEEVSNLSVESNSLHNPSHDNNDSSNNTRRHISISDNNPIFKGYNGVLGELNSRFKGDPPTATTTAATSSMSNGHIGPKHSSQRSLESECRLPGACLDYPDNGDVRGFGDPPYRRVQSTSTADIRCRVFTTSDNRHKRFSGDFALSPSDRTPSQPALTSRPYPYNTQQPQKQGPARVPDGESGVRHARSTSGLSTSNPPITSRVSFSRSHAALSQEPSRNAPRQNEHSHRLSATPTIEPISEQAALEAMLAELSGPLSSERRSLTRTNSTRSRKYPQRAITKGRVPGIGRGGSNAPDQPTKITTTPNSKSCGTLSQSVVTGGSDMKSSRTMSAISSKQTDVTVSTSFERPEQQKQIDSLSQTITSGRKVADMILKTFESLPVNYTSGRDILSSDKTAILREQYDLDNVLESAETEVFSGDITLNKVFCLKKDGRFSGTTHTCSAPTSIPPPDTVLCLHRNIVDISDEHSDISNTTIISKTSNTTSDTKSSTLKRQPQLEVISPVSELNLRELEEKAKRIKNELSQGEHRDLGMKDHFSTVKKSCTAPRATPYPRELSNQIPSFLSQNNNSTTKLSQASIPDPPKLQAPKAPDHDYINLTNGHDITTVPESSVLPISRGSLTTVNTDNRRDYVNTKYIKVDQSKDEAVKLSPQLSNDLNAYERSHSHLLTEEWNIDREIPRKKKHASSTNTIESDSPGLSSNYQSCENNEEDTIVADPILTHNKNKISISPERSTFTPERSSDSSCRGNSPSLECAFESALEDLSGDEDSDQDTRQSFQKHQQDDGVVLHDLFTAVNFCSSSLPPDSERSQSQNETVTVTDVVEDEDCFFPYLTGTNSRQHAVGDIRTSLSDTCDSGNDSAHASKPYDSGDDLDLDDLVNANVAFPSTSSSFSSGHIPSGQGTPATLAALTTTPRKKQRYKGPSEKLSVDEFHQFHDTKECTSEHNTSMSTSAVSSMDGVTFIDSDDDDFVTEPTCSNELETTLACPVITRVCQDSNDSNEHDTTDVLTKNPPQSWNTLMCEDTSSIHPTTVEKNNSSARYIYKASSSKGNSNRFDEACRKAGINNAITSSELWNNDQKVISEQLDIKKVTLNFSLPAEIRVKLPEHLLQAHKLRQDTRKVVNIRKCYRIKSDGSRELIEPPVITTIGYSKNEPLPSILKSSSVYKQQELDINTTDEAETTEFADVPLDVNLHYHHVKLNKNKTTASASLQRSIEHTEQQLQTISNRSGTKETTL